MRDIIFHYHIFKNAGSSFSAILDRNFGSHHLNLEASLPWGVLHQDEIVKFFHANPQMKAVSSHTARFLPKKIDGIRLHPMLFLRHPLDRVGSVYSFERRQLNDSPSIGAKIARDSGIREYVSWRLKKGNGAVIRNFQVTYLAGREQDMRIAEPTLEDYKLALARIEQMSVFGIVENFHESVVIFTKYFEREVGAFDRQITRENQSPDRDEKLETRIVTLKQELGELLYEELLEKNSLDIELYSAASKLFQSILRRNGLQG